MAEIDLIPAEYAKRAVVRRRIKPLLLALAAVALLVGLARLSLHLLTGLENANIAQLRKQGEVSAQARGNADQLRQQKLLAEKQLAELDELRGRDRLALLLRAIDAAHGDSIWLEQLRFFRRDPPAAAAPKPGAPAPAPAGAPAAAPAGTEQRVEIVGHATDHTRLAEFMRSLGSQPGIAEVRLVDTGLGSYARAPVIDLTLTLTIDDKPRRPQ